MMNMQDMMKQAQKMQKQMQGAQEELAAMSFVGESAQALVTATFTGDKRLMALQLKPEAVDPEDAETLEDLIVAAVNDGLAKVDAATEQKLGKFTKGLPF